MKRDEKIIMQKLESYSRFFGNHKPNIDTVFRTYKEAIKQIGIIIDRINENPFHPENDYKEQILDDIETAFKELERLKTVL